MSLGWSSCVLDGRCGVTDERGADELHSTASIGKIFLLCEVAERIVDGRLDPGEVLACDPHLAVADSGLWQHLAQRSLPLHDVALLVGSVSDNWATNVLLDRVGLDAILGRARALGCTVSTLHDRVRDTRSAADPPALSSATLRTRSGAASSSLRRTSLRAGPRTPQPRPLTGRTVALGGDAECPMRGASLVPVLGVP